MYCLRASSAERIDFFKACVVKTGDGIKVLGGNVRVYYPLRVTFTPEGTLSSVDSTQDQLFYIPESGFDRMRGFVREVEEGARAATTYADQFAAARSRDTCSVDMSQQLGALLREVGAMPLLDYLDKNPI
jgi:hypothetical protein